MALLRSADFPGDLGAINISLLRSEEMIFARASLACRGWKCVLYASASRVLAAYRTHFFQSGGRTIDHRTIAPSMSSAASATKNGEYPIFETSAPIINENSKRPALPNVP